MTRTWTFQGYYGLGNLGDEVMLYGLLHALSEVIPGLEVRVLMAPGGSADELLLPPGIDVEPVTIHGIRDVLAALRGAEALVWGGGTCLHGRGACGLKRNLLARLLGKRVVWVGVGVEEVERWGAMLRGRLSLAAAHGVAFRDSVSSSLASSRLKGPPRSAVTDDLSFLTLGTPIVSGEPGQHPRYLVVSWRELAHVMPSNDEGRYLVRLAKAVESVVREDGGIDEVRVVSFARRVDRVAVLNLFAALGSTEISDRVTVHDNFTVTEVLEEIRGAVGVVSVRLHGLLMAKMMGVPAIGLRYAPKVVRAGGYFHDDPTLDFTAMGEEGEGVAALLRREMATPAEWREDLTTYVDRARSNVDFLRRMLNA
jgi:polysaccharide pyruvyl transferase WcaK-like protein